MGVADAVPGVSGGTIALIAGVYRPLIAQLAAIVRIVRCPWSKEAWGQLPSIIVFLAPLMVMLLTALVITTRVLVGKPPELGGMSLEQGTEILRAGGGLLMNPDTAPMVFAFFFGLVAASVVIPLNKRVNKHARHYVLLSMGALIAGTLALLPPAAGSVAPVALIISGAIAISVMLLPGVSGSLALLVMGMYHPISEALNRFDLVTMAWVGIGVVLGVSLVIPLLNRLLNKAYDGTMATLAGLMLGSLAALWPWKSHYAPKQIGEWGAMTPQLPSAAWWWPILFMLIGVLLILLIERPGTPSKKHKSL